MADKNKHFSDEELDSKLDELDKQLTPDRLRKLLKANLLQRTNKGEVKLLDFLYPETIWKDQIKVYKY